MKSIYLDRTGVLKNTTWAILSPDGKEKLTRAGRGPFHHYRNAAQMAAGMNEIARSYKVSSKKIGSDTQLPYAESVDIGLNIAAADIIPMVVVLSNDEDKQKSLEEKLLPLVWKDDSVKGQFAYAKVSDTKELSVLTGVEGGQKKVDAILIVEPGQFGLSGKVLHQFDADVTSEDLRAALVDTVMNCERLAKDHKSHVNLGIQLGVDWQSEIPETDPESVRARQRVRGK